MKTIAVSQRVQKIEKYNEFRDQIDNRLIFYLSNAGYIPVPIPNFKNKNKYNKTSIVSWLKKINPSGIVLSGGDDLGVYKYRDLNEMRIIEWSLKKKVPVLGICRGMQIINKYFGGTQVKIKNHVSKRHKIVINSKLNRVVNSFHNWGFYSENIPNIFKITSKAKDKTIESFECKKINFYGIMWHPEREKKLKKNDFLLLKNIFR